MSSSILKIVYIYPHNVSIINNVYHHPYLNQILKGYHYISNNITCIISNRPLKNLDETSKTTELTGYNIYLIPSMSSIRGILKLENPLIEEEVKKADLVITKLPSFEGFTAIKYAKKYNKKVFVEMVACPWDAYYNHSLKGKILAPYVTYLTKKYVQEPDFVQYVSNQFLQSRYPTSKRNIGCSDVKITPVNFEEVKNKYQNYKQKDTIILGTSAAINVKYKGQAEIIKLLPELNKGDKKFEYHLAGGGDKTRLETLAKSLGVADKVKFLGLLDKEGVNNFLDQTDIYVQPSRQEGLSRALVEAMSRGCFCIASNVGGNPELLEKHLIYNVNKPIQVLNLIKQLDQEQLIFTSHRNFKFAENFETRLLRDKIESFYDEIIYHIN